MSFFALERNPYILSQIMSYRFAWDTCRGALSQIRLQRVAVAGFLQTLNSSFFNLTDTLLGQIILLTNLLNGYTIFSIQTKVSRYDFCFTRAQRFQHTANF